MNTTNLKLCKRLNINLGHCYCHVTKRFQTNVLPQQHEYRAVTLVLNAEHKHHQQSPTRITCINIARLSDPKVVNNV